MKTPEELKAHYFATNSPAGSRRLARNWRLAAIALLLVAIAAFVSGHHIIGVIVLAVAHLFSKEASACSGWAGGYEIGRRHEAQRRDNPDA